jgi:hypothetical protein
LTVGIKNSSAQAGALDGFLGNQTIKLLFPPEAQKVEAKLRQIGLGSECDKFITTLNRGQKAAGQAVPIFVDAISKMTIQDALSILKGDKDAATQYLKRTSSDALAKAFALSWKNLSIRQERPNCMAILRLLITRFHLQLKAKSRFERICYTKSNRWFICVSSTRRTKDS